MTMSLSIRYSKYNICASLQGTEKTLRYFFLTCLSVTNSVRQNFTKTWVNMLPSYLFNLILQQNYSLTIELISALSFLKSFLSMLQIRIFFVVTLIQFKPQTFINFIASFCWQLFCQSKALKNKNRFLLYLFESKVVNNVILRLGSDSGPWRLDPDPRH
jgi:hypothetical protein